jgi:mono/diheme cytochrome c family protein
MTMAFRSAPALVAATLGWLALSSPGPAGRSAATPASEGRTAFVAYGCAQCHGTEAQGSLSVPALRGYTSDILLAKLRTKSGAMPRYSARILPDAHVSRMATFLQSLKSGRPASHIPALTQ